MNPSLPIWKSRAASGSSGLSSQGLPLPPTAGQEPRGRKTRAPCSQPALPPNDSVMLLRDCVGLCREKDRLNHQGCSGMVPVYGVLRDRLRPGLLCRKAGNRTLCGTLGKPTLECSLELTERSYFFEGSEAGAFQTCGDGVGTGPFLCAECKQRSGFLPYGGHDPIFGVDVDVHTEGLHTLAPGGSLPTYPLRRMAPPELVHPGRRR